MQYAFEIFSLSKKGEKIPSLFDTIIRNVAKINDEKGIPVPEFFVWSSEELRIDVDWPGVKTTFKDHPKFTCQVFVNAINLQRPLVYILPEELNIFIDVIDKNVFYHSSPPMSIIQNTCRR
uniref:Uncharacterized protein n=1 Tax=Marseillevirus LCMAC102 TaxID=2506603 RepID=A0A481YU03_9VIRU|nr:MAG: hypothetical protein LCMAC102_02220 [Marseillevirus LCMAC102]